MTEIACASPIFVPNVAYVQIHAVVDSAHLHLVGFPQGFFETFIFALA